MRSLNGCGGHRSPILSVALTSTEAIQPLFPFVERYRAFSPILRVDPKCGGQGSGTPGQRRWL